MGLFSQITVGVCLLVCNEFEMNCLYEHSVRKVYQLLNLIELNYLYCVIN